MNSITSKSLIKSLGKLVWNFVQAFQPNNLPTFNPIPSLPHSSLFCQCHLLRFKLIKKDLRFFTKTNPKKWRFFFDKNLSDTKPTNKTGGWGEATGKNGPHQKAMSTIPNIFRLSLTFGECDGKVWSRRHSSCRMLKIASRNSPEKTPKVTSQISWASK